MFLREGLFLPRGFGRFVRWFRGGAVGLYVFLHRYRFSVFLRFLLRFYGLLLSLLLGRVFVGYGYSLFCHLFSLLRGYVRQYRFFRGARTRVIRFFRFFLYHRQYLSRPSLVPFLRSFRVRHGAMVFRAICFVSYRPARTNPRVAGGTFMDVILFCRRRRTSWVLCGEVWWGAFLVVRGSQSFVSVAYFFRDVYVDARVQDGCYSFPVSMPFFSRRAPSLLYRVLYLFL